MKRSDLLGLLRYAGYHEDTRRWVRLYVENHVSRAVANAEWAKGQAMRRAGERCSCRDCALAPQADHHAAPAAANEEG